ncbi:MAG: sulfatase-like hydrolase/transferase [Candidatus Sumerlaeota bacterium]|nr:sulfatase-like hydrolase/transferase [Candidatus Sumerlaeota bacterium]
MSDKPNILFLLNDHQAYYRHGWDAGPRIQRPQFDRLARRGIDFNRAYAACPLCGPARRTMLTGLYAHNHGEIKNDTNYPFDREDYFDILAANGYRNYYYGKWHAGPGTALDHHCEGFNYSSYNNPFTKPEYKDYLKQKGLPEPKILIERSFTPPILLGGRPNPMKEGQIYRQQGPWSAEPGVGLLLTPKETHESFFLANLACDRLKELAANNEGAPWHLRVDFWGPHQPYTPTREFADLYDPDSIPEYGNFRDSLENKPQVYRSDWGYRISENHKIIVPNPLPWSEWQKVLARAYAQITLVDAAAGMILDALDALGLAENTFVLWTTDHGDCVACHGGHFDKRSYMPEELLRIPMAVRWPGRVASGQTSGRLVSNLDVAPTILDAAGLGFGNPIDGASVLPVCMDPSADWRDDLLCETHGHAEDVLGRLVVTERYKYVHNEGDMDELYDLRNDVYELNNLIDSSAHRDVLADMRERLAKWRERTKDHPEAPDSPWSRWLQKARTG